MDDLGVPLLGNLHMEKIVGQSHFRLVFSRDNGGGVPTQEIVCKSTRILGEHVASIHGQITQIGGACSLYDGRIFI